MRKRLSYSILVILSLILVSSFVVYAAFVMTHNYEANINYHEIVINNSTLTTQTISDDLIFSEPGDEVSFTYKINNKADKNYRYYFSLTAEQDTINEELLNMIYVFQDGVYCGVLADYLTANLPDNLPTNKIVFKNEELTNATTITYQLHNSAYNFSDTSIDVTVKCYLETMNAQEYLFATNADLDNVMSDLNSDENILVLAEDITILADSNYSITSNSTIDLCGNNLILNDDVTVTGDIKIIDSRGGGSITGDGNLVLSGAESFVELEVSTNNIVTTNGYNQTRLYECLVDTLNSFDYFVNNETYNVYGNYTVYGNSFLTFKDITFANNVAGVSSNGVASITCTVGSNTKTIEYKTYLSDTDTLIETIKATELKHIVAYDSTTTTYDLLHDIYLPTALKKYNATISWWSSDESILSSEGIAEEVQGFVTLVATIKLNDEIFTETFLIHVAKQDDMMRLQYLISKIGMIELDYVGIGGGVILPTLVEDIPDGTSEENKINYYKYYTEESLGITEINYEVENSYYYLGLENGNKVYLNQVTFQKYARVKINAKFEGGSDEGETGYVNVKISLQNDMSLQKKVFDYVQTQLDAVNVLELILQTREEYGVNNERGDFTLPTEYMNIGIRYKIAQSTATETVYNEDIVSSTSADGLITLDLNKLKLNEIRVPITVELVLDEEKDEAASKILYFIVPPALTVDNFGFTESMDIFNTLQLQTLQYNEEHYLSTDSGELYFNQIDDISYIENLNNYNTTTRKKYILMYDIEQCEELIFELGNTSVVLDKYQISHLQMLFDWATDTTGTKTRSEVPLDSSLDWIISDNKATISDGEILVILTYCEKYIGFENEWIKDIHVGDNILSAEDIVDLMSTLVDQEFISLLDWATGSETITYPTIQTELEDYLSSSLADGKSTISYLEEEVIVAYVETKYATNTTVRDAVLNVWRQSITKTDDVYLNDSRDTTPFTNVPTTMTSDYVFAKLITWETSTSSYDLTDLLIDGEVDALFGGVDSANYTYNGGLTGGKYRVTSNDEWEVIKEYFLNHYNLDLKQYIYSGNTLKDFDEDNGNGLTFRSPRGGEYTVANARTAVIFTVGYYLTDGFLNELQAIANSYMTNMNNVQSLMTWATTITTDTKTNAPVTVSINYQIDGQSVDLNVRPNDGRQTVTMFEYSAIVDYYDRNACLNVDSTLREWFKSYYITSKLDLSFANNALDTNERGALYEAIGKLETFNDMISLITTTKSYAPKLEGEETTIWYDNLYTVSQEEYNKLVTTFSNNTKFIEKLNNAIKFEATPDRTLNNSNLLISFVQQYLEYSEGDYFKYSLINKIDNNDLSVLECLKYYEALEILSLRGNSISLICDDTNRIFNIVGTNNFNLRELEFTYCELTDISPIVNLTNLEVINLRGNSTLTSIHYLLEINNGQIKMINIFGTGVDFTYTEPDFIKMFIEYRDTHNGETPKYYYNNKGVETIYTLPTDLTKADFEAMDLCYLLASIVETNSTRLQLTKTVSILVDGEVVDVPIVWAKVDGAVSNPVLSKDGKGYYVTTNGGEITISATITYGEGTYTRYFTFINNI